MKLMQSLCFKMLILALFLSFSLSDFTTFKNSLQAKVKQIADNMTQIYADRCNSTLRSCQTKSYNYCQGTGAKQCLNGFPGPGGCIGSGAYLSRASAVRFPSNVNPQGLTDQQRQFVCTSAQLDSVFADLYATNSNQYTFTYFGTSLGSFRNFPSNTQGKQSNGTCKNYDPRFRPWYVTGASSGKNVIVIIDISGSMSGTRITTAIAASKAVLNTFSNNDFIGVIKFSSSASALKNNQIKRATSQYKKQLESEIDSLSPNGSTNYQSAFNLAFSLLNQAGSDEFGSPCQNAQNVILFLTDGAPTAGATSFAGLKSVIDGQNSGKNIILFTYGMDSDSGGVDSTLLKSLACQYRGIYFGFTTASSSSELLTQMRSYYTYISEGVNVLQPMWTQPYQDAFGFGTVVTVSMPAYFTNSSTGFKRILGVAGIDVQFSYVSNNFGLSSDQMEKRLLNNAPCYSNSLSSCDIEQLRPSTAKCGVTGCSAAPTQFICGASITSNIYLTPISKDQNLCCGLTVGGLVGIIIGIVVAVIIIVIIVICLFKKAQARAAMNQQLQNDSFKNQSNNNINNIIIENRYDLPPQNNMYNNNMGNMGNMGQPYINNNQPNWNGPPMY